jgi:hypothetical protein
MIVTTNDGLKLECQSSRELVEKLRAQSWGGPAASKEKWMREVALRANASTGKRIRANSPSNFIQDLVNAGLLKKEI